MEEKKDAVSAMQEAVDNLALSMFDSLRLIPFSREVEGAKRSATAQPDQGTESVSIKKPVVTDAAWASQIQTLAEGVLEHAASLDRLIDTLPGAELRENQQLEEIARLDKEGRRTRTELVKITDKAEGLREEVNGKLDRLADHMLKIPP